MKKSKLTVIALLAFTQGCFFSKYRNSSIADVNDLGTGVSTRNRYCISCVYDDESMKTLACDRAVFERLYPGVFSQNGMPVVLRIGFDKTPDLSHGILSTLMMGFSLGLIPSAHNMTANFNCSIELAEDDSCQTVTKISERVDVSQSFLLPTAYLCHIGTPDVNGGCVRSIHEFRCRDFYTQKELVFSSDGEIASIPNYSAAGVMERKLQQQALAYAVAVKLKEFEDSGKVDALLQSKKASESTAPLHRVTKLDRVAGKDFSYLFEIELQQSSEDRKAAFASVLSDFMKSLREDYQESHQNADASSFVVSFANLKQDNLRIGGMASVLTIKPIALSYDANMRRGQMSVQFGSGQEAEARDWVCRNIKTLVRDKNIALTSNRLPPEAKYQILDVIVAGNVLKIRFKAE